MSAIFSFEFPGAQALAGTLVHFLWQGAAIGLAAFLLVRILRLGAASRYAVGIAALALMLGASVATFLVLDSRPLSAQQSAPDAVSPGFPDAGVPPAAGALAGALPRILPDAALRPPAVPLIILFWAAGVAVLSVRLLGGWLVAQRLVTRAVRPVSPDIRALAHRIACRLRLDRLVRLLESTAVAVPVTIGWLRPVVLLPAAALTGLSPDQIEALLAHELAHVRRRDYLVNMLLSAVETLLFYHPAVWWASRLVRAEREHCCDDAAVRICDRLVYATALTDLAAIGAPGRVAMAASGGSLLARVSRILGHSAGEDRTGSGWLALIVLVLVAGAVLPATLTSAPPIPQGMSQAVERSRAAGSAPDTAAGTAADQKPEAVAGAVAGEPASAAPAPQTAQSQEGLARLAALEREKQIQLRALQENLTALTRQLQTLAEAGESAKQETEIAKLEIALKLARERYETVKRRVEVGTESPDTLKATESELSALEAKIAAARQGGPAREAKLRLADLTAQLENAHRQLERARMQYDAGLTSASSIREAESLVATTELELAAVRKQLQLQETGADLQRRMAERQEEIAKIEQALREVGTQIQAMRAAAEQELQERARLVEAARAEREARLIQARTVERDERLLSSSAPVDDANATVRAGDVLVIEIAGEPDLPRVYAVDSGGAVRLPLIGNIAVMNLKAAQVRDAVVRALTERRLAGKPAVTVTLRRPR